MKNTLTLLLAALVSFNAPAADDLIAILQQGLFEEEAEHDLAAAIKAYQFVVAGADAQRKLAATAVFRLGECYRKLGQTNEAATQYQRILNDFADQTNLVTLSRQNLVGLSVTKTSATGSGSTASTGLLEAQLAATQADASQAGTVVRRLEALGRLELRRVLPTVAPDALLARLLDELALAEGRAAEQLATMTKDHPEAKATRNKIEAIQVQIDERTTGILEGLRLKAGVLSQQVEDMKRELANQPTARPAAAGRAAPTPSQVEAHRLLIERLQLEIRIEEREVARYKEMIRQKLVPDNSAEKAEARLLDLRRQLVLARDSGAVGTADTTGAATDEEDGEVRRIQALIKDSPDLVNAKSVEVGKYGDSMRYGTPLHKAAQQGQLVVARFLINNGADLDSRDGFGRAPLHWAALNGHKSMAELLLTKGADPNATIRPGLSSAGFTPLHFAAQNGYRNVCEALLAGKADVNGQSDGNRFTPLHYAAERGFTSVAELLLAKGADVNSGSGVGTTPLITAAGAGMKGVVQLLLTNKADINAQNTQGSTALHAAVTGNHDDVLQLLLAEKANPNLALNEKSSNPGWTPLSAAINRDDVPMARQLLQYGADPNVLLYRNGWTALMHAAQKGSVELTAALIAAGADVNARDTGDAPVTALYTVARDNPTNAAAIVELLLKNKAEVNAADAHGSTPLIAAVHRRNPEVVKLLVEHGADVNALTRQGESPLSLIKPNRQQSYGANVFSAAPIPGAVQGRPPRSIRNVAGVPGQPDNPPPDPTSEIIALLEQRGARHDLRRLTAISTSRNQENRAGWFFKGTNDWNHYTLLELIAWINPRRGANTGLDFPDLSRIAIGRIDPTTAKTEDFRINLVAALTNSDCARDLPLRWGDVVDIPELDHFVDVHWTYFPDAYYQTFQKCLERTIRVTIKGQTSEVILTPFRFKTNTVRMPGSPTPWESRMSSFRLNPFLRNSGLLLTSSDVTRVKVKRIDPTTKQVRERVFNLDLITNEDINDLWLRDGDLIEVPEKDGNRAAAASPRADATAESFSVQFQFTPLPPKD